jgi:uncharacterized Ntn-hydrolase superfamily protein
MTFSILAQDSATGALGGAAATGSLCVGGWVLRGSLGAGMSASQGASPSTFWGEDVLAAMRAGARAEEAVDRIVNADNGRAYRQLAALPPDGIGAAFTGQHNTPQMGSRAFEGGIVSGNMLTDTAVLEAMVAGYTTAPGAFADRLVAALRAAADAGGDLRGLNSAALLVLHPDTAPLSLRIDYHPDDPVGALADLLRRATGGDYARWTRQVPTATCRERVLD